MAPIALGTKHQDLLKAYLEVPKSEKPDWAAIAGKADFPTAKYARDQWTIVKNKLAATGNGDGIDLSDRHITLLKATIEVAKSSSTDWDQVARIANFKTSKYARDQWTIVRNKLISAGAGNGGSTSGTTTPAKGKTGKSPGSQKRKKREDGSDDEDKSPELDEELAKTPKKRGRKTKAKAKDSSVPAGGDEDEAAGGVEAEASVAVKAEPEDALEDDSFEANMFR